MSAAPEVRRRDKQVPEAECWAFLGQARCGRLGTVSPGGEPYVIPLLFVVLDGAIWVHTTAAAGHVRSNVGDGAAACFEADDVGEVYAYGRFECDTGISYRSVVAFGRIAVVPDVRLKTRFLDAFMRKYAPHIGGRPVSFYPRIDAIAVYRFEVSRLSGKRTALPAAADQWPARDRTMTPQARPPSAQ